MNNGPKWLKAGAYFGGAILTLFGVFFLGAYIWGAIDTFANDTGDRSWLFWGLGLAFIGLIFGSVGIGLFVMGRKLGRPPEPSWDDFYIDSQ